MARTHKWVSMSCTGGMYSSSPAQHSAGCGCIGKWIVKGLGNSVHHEAAPQKLAHRLAETMT